MKKAVRLKNYKEKILDIAYYSITGGALFLQNLLFYEIATKGYFRAAEQNPYILGAELGITILGDFLFLKNYVKFLKSLKKRD
ncbi:MAG: hypothetical protein QXQ69_01035 [Candidatus Aenigmatarchaeota archaeon]